MTVVDPQDDAQFAAWYEAFSRGAAAGRPAPLVVPAETVHRQLLDQTRARRLALGVFEGSSCSGAALLEWDTEHNTHLGEVDVDVVPERRRQGIGTALLDRLVTEADAVGLTTLVGEVNVVGGASPGLGFAVAHGFASVHTEHHLVLDLPLTPTRLATLSAVREDRRRGYTLDCWSGPTPGSSREAMARLRTGMNAEVPTGDLDTDPEVVSVESLTATEQRLAARGYLSSTALVRDPEGSPAGYSLLFAQPNDPVNALQDDTYVLAGHRGRGIGCWLKAGNLGALQDSFPRARVLHSWTDEVNGPMQAINALFGFAPVEVTHEVQRGAR